MIEYYMQRPDEIAKHNAIMRAKGYPECPGGSEDFIRTMAAGDGHVFAAMWSFWNFEHVFDDLMDEGGHRAEEVEAHFAVVHDAVVEALLTLHHDAERRLFVVLDKLIFRGPWDMERKVLAHRAAVYFFTQMRVNPFIRSHAPEFRALYVQCLTRCLDGDEMGRSADVTRKAMGLAVRCGDVDALLHMIYLARGWAALRECARFREYDLPDEELA